MARKQGGRDFSVSREGQKGKKKNFALKGGRALSTARAILLCEDTSSAYYYFKFFVSKYQLAVEIEPKTKQTKRMATPKGLNDIFVKANYFHLNYPDRKILMTYDLDEFYRQTAPKEFNKKAYEAFLRENKDNDQFVYLDSFPCFEFWLLLHFGHTKKYYDSYSELFHSLNKYCKNNNFPQIDKRGSCYYEKSEKYWKRLCDNLFEYFPQDSLKGAISYSNTYELKIGENSHSNIGKFFDFFKESMDFLSSE